MDMDTNISDVQEGKMTRAVEDATAKVPSIGYLGLALGSVILSAVTTLALGKRTLGNFFGLWAPTILLIGVYNKLAKMEANMERKTILH